MFIVTGPESGTQTTPEVVAYDEALGFFGILTMDEKFTDDDVLEFPWLEGYALGYVEGYTGSFEYMVSMQDAYAKWGELRVGQIRGVLNCLRAEVLRTRRVEEAKAQPQPTVEVAAGRYCTLTPATGARRFWRVDRPAEGKWQGYTFVREIHIWGSDNGERNIRNPEERNAALASIAADSDALARYGRETGICGRCGRTLTDPESVRLGIGPICINL